MHLQHCHPGMQPDELQNASGVKAFSHSAIAFDFYRPEAFLPPQEALASRFGMVQLLTTKHHMSDLTIYTVAWICAIGTELVAAKQFLDEAHDDADQLPANDDNAYVSGKVGRHNIVITTLPHGEYGLVSAAVVARYMARSFPNLRFALMVGIGGGAPCPRHDIRLGDIVVSSPDSGIGGVIQYDFGKTIQDESFKVTRHLNQSPQCLLRAIPLLKANYESDGNGIDTTIPRILETKLRLRAKYKKPESSTDKLFSSAYKHGGDKDQECTAVCVDVSQLVVRPARPEE